MTTVSLVLQVQQQKVAELTLELQETNNKLEESRALKAAADQRILEMTQELENNAGRYWSAWLACIGTDAGRLTITE